MRRCLILPVVLLLLGARSALAVDEVQTSRTIIRGSIQRRSHDEIVIQPTAGAEQRVPVNEVAGVRYDGEPPKLQPLRQAALRGRYEDTAAELEALLKEEDIQRAEVEEDIRFYQAYCAAQLALAGKGDINAAGRQVMDFLKQYDQTHHFYESQELMGNLLAAVGKPDLAMRYFDAIDQAPWPEYKVKAAVLKGQALRRQKQPQEALAQFDRAIELAQTLEGDTVAAQRRSAQLGRAACMADSQQASEAIGIVHEIIKQADPENSALRAQAYNALGYCHQAAGKSKEALLAYLHVDVLYFQSPQEHAEALTHLATLWNEVGQTDRAAEAREILKSRYGVTLN
jgi:tetratricopeptide (TPR) repeat protein